MAQGVFVPYGLATEYENNYQGRRFAKDSDVAVLAIQPTLSYRINEQWSLGAGVSASHIEGKLSSAVDPFAIPGGEGEFKVEGDDWGWAYTVGLMFQATDATRIGLTYRSKVEYTLDGDATNCRIGLGPFGSIAAGKYDASLDLTTRKTSSCRLPPVRLALDRLCRLWTRWQGSGYRVAGKCLGPVPKVTEEQNWHEHPQLRRRPVACAGQGMGTQRRGVRPDAEQQHQPLAAHPQRRSLCMGTGRRLYPGQPAEPDPRPGLCLPGRAGQHP